MYLYLPEYINSVCLYTNPWKLILLICKLFTKNMYALYISNHFFIPWWYRQHWSCHLTSEYFNLLIEFAHVIDLYCHAGLCYMIWQAWPVMAM